MDPNIDPSANNMLGRPNSSLTTSPLFGDPDADITFESSDGVLFKIYRKYLEATSAGFTAPPCVETDLEPVSLEEPSEVLEILFQFIHPPTESQQYRQPNMAVDVQSKAVFAVAEAAEKYLVFGAMNTCLLRMEHIAGQYPLEILNHCYKHGYKELADQVAPHTITFPLPKVAVTLTHPGLLPEWLVYYDHWMELSRFTRTFIQQASTSKCGRVIGWEATFLNAFAHNPRCVFSPPPIPTGSGLTCIYGGSCHVGDMNTLFSELFRKANAIPKFSSIRISS